MTCKNRMKGVLLFLFLIWGVVEQVYPQQALQSPDGKYNFVFEQKDGRLTYHLDYANKQVIEEGDLGVNIDNHLVESAMGIPVDNSKVLLDLVAIAMLFSPILRIFAENNANNLRKTCIIR